MSANTATPDSPAGAGSSPSPLFGVAARYGWHPGCEGKVYHPGDEVKATPEIRNREQGYVIELVQRGPSQGIRSGVPVFETSLPFSALIRHCDRCLAVTAFDLDNTPANAKAMKLPGQTVRVMYADEVKGMKLERCKCKPDA